MAWTLFYILADFVWIVLLWNRFKEQKEKFLELWNQRKELHRVVNVDVLQFEDSQARDMVRLLQDRIEKHNSRITQANRMLAFQQTMDARSEIKKAGELEAVLVSRFKSEHEDISNLLETYKVKRETPVNETRELVTSFFEEDFNKRDLDKLLQDEADLMGFILDSGEKENLLKA
jgi:hypothetical protein